ncbi:hypothetical protein E2C01_041484 [Portunus trituberculatus]|uniref:Uncharacterized protein n=1 Tax=Portunus trituberculatus TaxID=210409 RepID=A0A5B7FS07_PORTR|nr:hypothetical protein [Portunus trituberculatus]
MFVTSKNRDDSHCAEYFQTGRNIEDHVDRCVRGCGESTRAAPNERTASLPRLPSSRRPRRRGSGEAGAPQVVAN